MGELWIIIAHKMRIIIGEYFMLAIFGGCLRFGMISGDTWSAISFINIIQIADTKPISKKCDFFYQNTFLILSYFYI